MMLNPMNHTLTDIPGIWVGHVQDYEAIAGCKVILRLCPAMLRLHDVNVGYAVYTTHYPIKS
jgi:L-aminopeptidase/D-esterase-like protein